MKVSRLTGVSAAAVAILIGVNFFNYMDRMAFAILLEPIKLELGASDTQMGLLSGLAFAAFYAVAGIPLGRLSDRTNRIKLLAICLATWSVMTALCGLARSFTQLFAARMGVGVGEAGCSPAAHSLIGDYFPPERRALGISLFQGGGLAGLSAGLLVAGLLADRLGWRTTLLVIGLSGLPMAILALRVMREPLRCTAHSLAEPAWDVIRALLERRALVHLILGIGVAGFSTYGIAQWLPAFFVRVHNLSLAQLGAWFSLSSGAGGILGILLGGWFAARLLGRDARWELWFPGLTYTLAAPLYIAVFLAPNVWAALLFKFFAATVACLGLGVSLSAIQTFAEPNRRGMAVALTLFVQALFGQGLGPLCVGVISDYLTPSFGPSGLRYALMMVTGLLAWSGLHFYLAARTAVDDSCGLSDVAVNFPSRIPEASG